jgi:hypothetical protein
MRVSSIRHSDRTSREPELVEGESRGEQEPQHFAVAITDAFALAWKVPKPRSILGWGKRGTGELARWGQKASGNASPLEFAG